MSIFRAKRLVWVWSLAPVGCVLCAFCSHRNLIKYSLRELNNALLKIGQPTKADPLALPDKSVERNVSKVSPCKTRCLAGQWGLKIWHSGCLSCRSQWPRCLRRGSAAARLLRLWFRIPPGAWIFVCCECCVLSGSCLCDGLIPSPEESYRLWCVVVCDLETSSRMRRSWPALGCSAIGRKKRRLLYKRERVIRH